MIKLSSNYRVIVEKGVEYINNNATNVNKLTDEQLKALRIDFRESDAFEYTLAEEGLKFATYQDAYDRIFDKLNVTEKSIKGEHRGGDILLARQLFHYMVNRDMETATLEKIGEETNNSHATVINSITKIESYIINPSIKQHAKVINVLGIFQYSPLEERYENIFNKDIVIKRSDGEIIFYEKDFKVYVKPRNVFNQTYRALK
jgi:hypothetical protein